MSKWQLVLNFFQNTPLRTSITREQYLSQFEGSITEVRLGEFRALLTRAGYLTRDKLGVYFRVKDIPRNLGYREIRRQYPRYGEHKKQNRNYQPGMSFEKLSQLIYYERNMVALRYADGWYYDKKNSWEGYKRVLSLDGGALTFHISDEFDVGNLKEIECNWDGHSNEEKWERIDRMFGIGLKK